MHRFQLEAADFRHRHGIRPRACYHAGIWDPDVPHYLHVKACMFHNAPQQRSGGSLAVCPCDCQHTAFFESIGKFNLPPDFDSKLLHLKGQWDVRRHPRAEYGNVILRQGFLRQLARLKLHLPKHGGFLPEFLRPGFRVPVIQHSFQPLAYQKLCRRNAADPSPHY